MEMNSTPPTTDCDARYVETTLYHLAHARAGDKGERLNICLFAYQPDAYETLCEEVTEARVLRLFAHRGARTVRRYLVPRLHGMNFVIDGTLEGGVNSSLNLDGHGKSHSFRLLSMSVTVPRSLIFTEGAS